MNPKGDVFLLFLILLLLTLVTFYVGAGSDILAFAKAGEQIAYFLEGRNPSGGWGSDQAPGPSAVPGSQGPSGGGSSGADSFQQSPFQQAIQGWKAALDSLSSTVVSLGGKLGGGGPTL